MSADSRSGMIKVDAGEDEGWVVFRGLSSVSACLPVCLSVFLSFCPSLPPFRPPVGENLGVERILSGSGGNSREDRSDMASLFRCNAAALRRMQRAVSSRCQCQRQCHIRFGLGLDR